MPIKDKSYQKRFDGKRKIAVLQIFSDLIYHFKTAGVRTSTIISISCTLAIFHHHIFHQLGQAFEYAWASARLKFVNGAVLPTALFLPGWEVWDSCPIFFSDLVAEQGQATGSGPERLSESEAGQGVSFAVPCFV